MSLASFQSDMSNSTRKPESARATLRTSERDWRIHCVSTLNSVLATSKPRRARGSLLSIVRKLFNY